MAARDEHFTPGFTTSSQAELITNALLTQGRMQQEMDTGDPSTASRSLLPVKLTGRSSVTGLYSWTEQTFDSTGARTDRPGGRSGTTTVSPVRLLGDAVLTTFPAEAWVVRCITTASGGIMYEGIAVGLDSFEEIELDTIRKACVTKASGVVTNITFEHQKVRILGVVLTDEAYCNTGDDDCCPTITTACCPTMPRCLQIVFSNGTGYWACLDSYVAYLEYSEATAKWELVERNPGAVAGGELITTCDNALDFHCQLWCYEGIWTILARIQHNSGGGGSSLCWALSGSMNIDGDPPVTAYPVGTIVCDPFGVTFTSQAINCTPTEPTGEGSGGTFDMAISEIACAYIPPGGTTTDGCCSTTSDFTVLISGGTDFAGLSGFYTFTYDPTQCSTDLSGDVMYADEFQWYADLVSWNGSVPRMYFGCKDGSWYFGVNTSNALSGCLTGLLVHTDFAIASATSFVSCEETPGSAWLVWYPGGIGGGVCDGTFNLFVYA